jgi:hypothetical protein
MPVCGSGYMYSRSVDFASSVAELLFVLINEYVTVKFQDFALVRSRASFYWDFKWRKLVFG